MLGALALLTLASLSLVLWALGNRVPYGYDASGAYLTYRAAYNATTFAADNPFVADTATSSDPAAHPAYDLQDPNVSGQLLSQVLLRSGVTDLGAHTGLGIVVSVLGFLLALHVLTRLGGAALAATSMLLFAVQYVGVLTWTTNLQTAVYFPLFWGNLWLLLWFVDRPIQARLAAVGLGISLVFVTNPALGALVLLTEVFLFGQLARPARRKVGFTVAAVLGAVVGLLFLMVVAGPDAAAAWLPIDPGSQWQQTPTAYRAMFGLGQGALALLVYSVLVVQVAAAAWRAAARGGRAMRTDLAALLVVALAIATALWLDRSTGLVDDWEPVSGRPVVHVGLWLALGGVLMVLGLRLWRFRPSRPDSLQAQDTEDAPDARRFVVALGLAILVLTILPIGNFTQTFVRNYAPALVFLEDVVLATCGLALLDEIRAARRWSLHAAAIGAVLVVFGVYWLAYQGTLAVRFPPREIGVASALRGNTALAGASFIAPNLASVVWYYTRGQALPVDSRPMAVPSFLICARVPTGPTPSAGCERWTTQLETLGYPLDQGRNPLQAPDYLIYALPPCGTLSVPLSVATATCGPLASSPPTLTPLTVAPDAPLVSLSVNLQSSDAVAHVDYNYAQAAGTPEQDSIVRLFVKLPAGDWCLVGETAGQDELHFPATSAGEFRASVIPRSVLAAGQQYFSTAQMVVPTYVFDLPDTKNGGVQHITAGSLNEAKQQAIAAGTWSPAAGTLGQDARTAQSDAPTADHLCRDPRT